MFNTLNLSQYLRSQMNNSMNPQHFTQPLTSSQLPRQDAQEMIQSVIMQHEEEMNIEKLDQNNSSNLDGMVKRESHACIPTQQNINQEFKRESPHVKISVYKQHQLANQKYYILQDDKIIGGNQAQKNEIQIIRRKKAGDNNLDFGLSGQQSNVESIPCKILTKYGFRYSSRITSEILFLLQLKYLPQGQSLHSKIAQLPSNVFKLIHQFIKVKPKFFVQDCGTSLKTLVRIQKDKPKTMHLNNKYLIGSDLYFNVVQLISIPKSTHKQNLETDNDYFFQTLVREHERDRSRIHGLTKEEQEMFQQYLKNYSQSKKKGRKQYSLLNCNRPFLKIQFDTPIVKQMAVFIAKEGQQQIFKIGRSQDCDIIVNINTVSRKQTQIKFNGNQWEICDGEGVKQSANGTWLSLQQYDNPLNSKSKQSIPIQIEDKMELKISENIFKFEMVGFGISKKRKLNNSLYKELTNIEQL